MDKKQKNSFLKTLFKWVFRLALIFLASSVVLTAAYIIINPPCTPLMLLRIVEGAFNGKSVGIDKDWKGYDEISPYIFKAVMSGEDSKFLQHNGFDWKAIERARKINERRNGKRLIGASTISMQTAKNVFLWPGRNYVRKGLEAYFTFLIEAFWSKRRILEVYANVVEWGDGIYGVEAASQHYFHKSAKDITAREAALLAAVLPNPRRWSPAEPTNYIKKRQGFIQSRMGGMPLPRKENTGSVQKKRKKNE